MVANRLEMRGISLAFGGVRALSRVEFTLQGGSVHALTGANGAGKSTLMAVLCGTHARYEGEIIINNQPVSIRTPHQAKQLGIHLVQQEVDVALVPGLSIAENILLDHLAQPGYRFRWAEVRRRAATRWRSSTRDSTSGAPLTAAPSPRSSRSCWRGRCRTAAAS
ncbi:Arabinose import ATP-binding protein AraG [Pluralibacter gergoviae]|nr:Arabinose import ATP-binding protein AraG [Pluralibacter gergoviae]